MLTREEALAAIEEHGSQRAAAAALGIPRTTFRDALARLNAEPPVYDGYEAERVSTMVRNEQGRPEWVKMQRRRGFTPEEIEEAFANIRIPAADMVPPPVDIEPGMSLFGIGDPHYGMRAYHRECGEDFDADICSRLHRGAFDYLLRRAPASDKALILLCGDNTHHDNNEAQTPRSKHSLDVDGRIGRTGWKLVSDVDWMIQEALKRFGHVTLVALQGNHDPTTSVLLNHAWSLRYINEPRVTVEDNTPLFIKHVYGKNLFGFTHTHTIKLQDFPMVMATDWRKEWGNAEHIYAMGGHLHRGSRGKVKVLRGDESLSEAVHLEHFPTIAAKDAYAAGSKYRHNRAMTRIDYHPDFGEVSRGRVTPDMLR